MASNSIQNCKHPECPVAIRMLLYRKTGNRAPIEARPSPDGNIHIDLEQGTYIILSGEELQRARDRQIPLHLNHFVTCEFAKQFTKAPEPVVEKPTRTVLHHVMQAVEKSPTMTRETAAFILAAITVSGGDFNKASVSNEAWATIINRILNEDLKSMEPELVATSSK